MKKNFPEYFKKNLNQITFFVFNIFLFLPYYFSVAHLLKTFFRPWKNLLEDKQTEGFSFKEWFNRSAFNIISRGIGATMRLSIILIFIIFQTIFVIIIPILIFLYLILTPISYIFYLMTKSPEEKKDELREKFLIDRIMKDENLEKGKEWFEIIYQKHLKTTYWWSRENLFSMPPLARDWDRGYTPNLNKFSYDLTTNFSHYKNLVNREKEIQAIEQALAKSQESNVLIIGDEGVGKHTIIEALAKKIYQGKCIPILSYKRIVKLEMEKILSQSGDISQKQQLLKTLLDEAAKSKNIIIFIDNFHKYVTDESGYIDLSTILAEFAKLSHIHIVGITTPFLYQKFIFNNEKINRLFEKVDVYEISKDEALQILLNLAYDMENRYKVKITYESIAEIINKSANYITHIPFPEKAIVLLDEACVALQQSKQRFLTPLFVDQILSEKIHVPLILNQDLKNKLLKIEDLIKQEVFFQDTAINKLAATLRKSFVISSQRKKPLASFLFLGPTGVGKTETAKSLARLFFGSEKNLIRLDMSFYQQKEDISNLLGSSLNNNPGILSQALREKPYGVLLLDEIEKSDKDLLNIFLTLLDEGYLIDGFGKKIDCKNLVVIATSNAGTDYINKLVTTNNSYDNLENLFFNYLIENHLFSPEFLNRFDGVIIYSPLFKDAIRKVIIKKLDLLKKEIYQGYKINLVFTDEFIDLIINKGYQTQYGARYIDRVLRDEVEDHLAKLILTGKVKENDTFNL